MVLQSVFKSSWIFFVLFSIGACVPARKSETDASYPSRGSQQRRGGSVSSGGASFGTGSGSTIGDIFSGVSGSDVGSSAAQGAGLSEMIAAILRLSPSSGRPLLQSHWSSPQVPLGMVATRPVFPSSLIVHTDSGYQRARDFRSDSKYTQDIFDNIPQPENPGSGPKGQQTF